MEYVNKEIAKLLKERGFDIETNRYFIDEIYKSIEANYDNWNDYDNSYSATKQKHWQ